MMDRRRFLSTALSKGAGIAFLSLPAVSLLSRDDMPVGGRSGRGGASRTGTSAGTADAPVLVERARVLMGTVVRVTACARSEREGHHAIGLAFDEIARLERLFTVFDADSDICRINAAAGRAAVRVDPETMAVLSRAMEFNALTRGAFDVTVEPCMRLWGFREEAQPAGGGSSHGGGSRGRLPTDAEIARTLDAIGMRHMEVDPRCGSAGLRVAGGAIDLGGIAVGYAVDRAVAVLRREGITAAFINHGGDAYALGAPPGEDGWRILVPHPLDPRRVAFERTLRDQAAATSANTEQFRVLDGIRCGHLMNVFSARPSGAASSVTVIAREAIVADALSTGAFCLGGTVPPGTSPDIDVLAVPSAGPEKG